VNVKPACAWAQFWDNNQRNIRRPLWANKVLSASVINSSLCPPQIVEGQNPRPKAYIDARKREKLTLKIQSTLHRNDRPKPRVWHLGFKPPEAVWGGVGGSKSQNEVLWPDFAFRPKAILGTQRYFPAPYPHHQLVISRQSAPSVLAYLGMVRAAGTDPKTTTLSLNHIENCMFGTIWDVNTIR
jgi:hypothetical protein